MAGKSSARAGAIAPPRSRIAGALRRLEEAIARDPGNLAPRVREFGRRFRRYSPFNRLLIMLQRPDATFLKGRRQWEAAGRTVRKGARAIWIMAPALAAGVRADAVSFTRVRVYDVADTDGPPFRVPALPPIVDAGGRAEALLGQLEGWVRASGLCLRRGAHEPNSTALGATDGLTIWVRAELAPPEALAVLAHEIAHAKLHFARRDRGRVLVIDEETRPSRDVRELQAELTAFLILALAGVDSCASSAAYLASWRASRAAIRAHLPRALAAAGSILGACERGRYRELSGVVAAHTRRTDPCARHLRSAPQAGHCSTPRGLRCSATILPRLAQMRQGGS